ncbi:MULTISPECIES: hypothetical protein [unclassified Streptomyces]|uniref:hypothetical protein n=1 Tax=unclassified Streptomyces TaxID=2593676 RepID=UPI0003A346D0|nr:MULTISPECIES: hypothetical protein [unclassified Streptomyces]MYT32605.1 hypothetical protein [Streptomyces sp. SID8354]
MSDSSRSALRLALRLADPATADALAERMRPQLLALLSDRLGLPRELVGELLGGEDAGRLRALLEEDPVEWLATAAGTGDPVLGPALWRAEYRDDDGSKNRAVEEAPGLLAILLEAADFMDDRWYAEDGLLNMVYEAEGAMMVPALTSGAAGLSMDLLAAFNPYLPPPAVVDACLSLFALWGTTAALEEFLRMHEDVPLLSHWHPWLPDMLRAALAVPDPETYLRGHRATEEWTDPEHLYALARVRCGCPGLTARPDGLDWALIRREHERLSFHRDNLPADDTGRAVTPLLLLTQWEGCPAHLLWESFRADPVETAKYAAELPFEAFTVLWTDREERNGVLYHALERGILAGRLPVKRVLAEVGPAEAVLAHLPLDHGPTRKALTDLLDALGPDPVNWLTFYARLSTAFGSVTELVADVTAMDAAARDVTATEATVTNVTATDANATDARMQRHKSWPRPAPAQFPAEQPDGARSAYLKALACASEEAQLAVVPHFDERAVQHLLVFGNPSPAVRETVVAAHGPSAQVAMAGSRALSEEKVRSLLDLDEPAVDAMLFRFGPLDRTEHERLLAGRLRAGGSRETVSGELLAALDDPDAVYDRAQLAAGLGSGDLGVAHRVLARLRPLHLPASRLRLLVAVWERGGPDAVREILATDHLPTALRDRTERQLASPHGLAELRSQLAEAESPAALLAYLTEPAGRPRERLQQLRGEGVMPPWQALGAARDAGTLPDELLDALVELPDCPRALLLAALEKTPVCGADWIRAALVGGRLTHTDVLMHAAPARAALHTLQQYPDERPGAAPHEDASHGDERHDAGPQPVCVQAELLTREHLGTDIDAWGRCLQLLPTFVGTLPELLATANAPMPQGI